MARLGRFGRLLLDTAPLREDREYRLLWSGMLVSGFGRQVTVVALPFQLYVLTGSTLAVGALAFVQLVPLLAVPLWAGAIADAVDRRRLLIVTQVGLAATAIALVLLSTLAAPPIWALYLVAFVATGIGAVDWPARSSAVPRLVPPERLPAALALGQVSFQLASVAGPAIGGILIGSIGLTAAYLVDVVGFSAALLALALMRPIPPLHAAARPGLEAIREGLRFARQARLILSTFVIDLNAMIFGMPTALFPALALDVFHVGATGVGLMAAAPAAGALAGAVLTGWVSSVRHQGRAVLWAVAAWGAAITAFGLAFFSFPLALLFLALAGAADVFSAVFRSTILQLGTPDELRGRVSALHILVVTSGPRIGDIEAAAVAAVAGPTVSVVTGGLLCLAGVGVVARRFPELRRYDAFRVVPLNVTLPSSGGGSGPAEEAHPDAVRTPTMSNTPGDGPTAPARGEVQEDRTRVRPDS